MAQRHMPLGYRMVNGEITVHEPQAEVVRRVFEQYLAGLSLIAIAKELTEARVPNANGKPSWSHCSVGHVLNNTKYSGQADYPAVLPAGWLEQAAARRTEQNRRLSRNTNSFANALNSKYVFSGKLRCGLCGGVFKRYTQRSKTKKTAKWRCKGYLKDNRVHCRSGSVTDGQIEEAFVRAIQHLLEHPEAADPPEQEAAAEAAQPEQPPSDDSPPEELQHIMDELAEGLRQARVDVPAMQQLLYEQAALLYRDAVIQDGEYQTAKLRKALEGCSRPIAFSPELFRRIIRHVTVYPEGRLIFTFINGVCREEPVKPTQ